MGCCDHDKCRACRVDGCSKKHAFVRRDEKIKVYSEFCIDHTCRYYIFDKTKTICTKSKDKSYNFCSTHRVCDAVNCTIRGDCPLGVSLPWMCPIHACVVENCYKKRHQHFGYCADHRCTVAGCFEKRTVDVEFCVDHHKTICREENCRGAIHAEFRCIIHQKCPVKDCKRHRFRHSDGIWDHCEHHNQEYRCIYKSCKSLAQTKGRYCSSHKCTFEGCTSCRDNEKDAEKTFCSEHSCAATRCYALAIVVKKGVFGSYCRRHTCTVANCHAVAEGGAYCHHHSCHWDDCNKMHLDGGTLCSEHECKKSGCRKIAKLRLGFCEEHRCKTADCVNSNDTGEDKLCHEHSRKELLNKIKQMEEKPKERCHDSRYYDDVKHRHEKIVCEYDDTIVRLRESDDEFCMRRKNRCSDEEDRKWRRCMEERNSRLQNDLKRVDSRADRWECQANELRRRVERLEALMADERHRHRSPEVFECQFADLLGRVDILEDELRVERSNHGLHQGRVREIERLRRTIVDLERRLCDEQGRAFSADELAREVDMLQNLLACEREQKESLRASMAQRGGYEFIHWDRDGRHRRIRRGSWERRSNPYGDVCG